MKKLLEIYNPCRAYRSYFDDCDAFNVCNHNGSVPVNPVEPPEIVLRPTSRWFGISIPVNDWESCDLTGMSELEFGVAYDEMPKQAWLCMSNNEGPSEVVSDPVYFTRGLMPRSKVLIDIESFSGHTFVLSCVRLLKFNFLSDGAVRLFAVVCR